MILYLLLNHFSINNNSKFLLMSINAFLNLFWYMESILLLCIPLANIYWAPTLPPHTVLGTKDTELNKTVSIPAFMELHHYTIYPVCFPALVGVLKFELLGLCSWDNSWHSVCWDSILWTQLPKARRSLELVSREMTFSYLSSSYFLTLFLL